MKITECLGNMDVRMLRIYFGHPKDSYNTEYELNCLKKIKELYPGCEVINPRDIEIAEEDKNPKGYAAFMKQMQKYYFPAIKDCNLIMVAKTRYGKISPGVQKEIGFAETKNIPVEYLDIQFPGDNVPTSTCYFCEKQVSNSDIDIVEHDDEFVSACWKCLVGIEENENEKNGRKRKT